MPTTFFSTANLPPTQQSVAEVMSAELTELFGLVHLIPGEDSSKARKALQTLLRCKDVVAKREALGQWKHQPAKGNRHG